MDRQRSALVIDDKEHWQRTLRRLLDDQDFCTDIAGTYALAKTLIEASAARGEPFDLAIVDLVLGPIEIYCGAGFALIERLLDLGTAVVIVSGYATPKLVDQTFKAFGFLGFLEKGGFEQETFDQTVELVSSLPGHLHQPTEYNLAAIRELITDGFSADELWRFCQTRSIFQPTLERFTRRSPLAEMVDALTEYCQKRLLFPELLTEIRVVNPRQYARYRSRVHRAETGAPAADRRLSAEDREQLERLLREAATGQRADDIHDLGQAA
jgi:FixJ family two-component response regulator